MPVGENTEPGSQMSTMLYAWRNKRHVLVCMRARARMCVCERERENPGKEDFFLSFNNKI